MAHPTTHRRTVAPSDPKPSPKPSTAAKPDPTAVSKSSHLCNPTPISKLQDFYVLTSQRPKNSHPTPVKDSHLQAKALNVSAIVDSSKFSVVKSKPQPRKIASGCNEKLRKYGKASDGIGKKEAKEEADRRSLNPAVKQKGLKELQERHRFDSLRPIASLSLRGGRRRSFGGSEVELGDIFANNGVKVVSVDMPPFMQIHAVDCARKAHDSMEKFTSKTLALSLKREFDGVYGPAWHCIVGKSFGSFVTHSVGGFLYFSMDQKLYILLFKTTVQRAE